MTDSKKLSCVVVTPERTVLEQEADFVAFPAFDGEVGVQPGHAPLVARLAPGELRLTGGTGNRLYVDGGFAQVHDNKIAILTPRAAFVKDLNRPALEQQLASINAEVPTGDEALEDKERRLLRIRTQLHLAK